MTIAVLLATSAMLDFRPGSVKRDSLLGAITVTMQTLLALFVVVLSLFSLVFRRRRNALRLLKGPPPQSYLLGHEYELMNADAGELEMKWVQEYGAVYCTAGCFGVLEKVLMVADPRALQHIFEAGYHYPRSKDNQRSFRALLGRGMLGAEADSHYRQRKALMQAFSASQSRTYLPVFQQYSQLLVEKWLFKIIEGVSVLNVYEWLSKTTLDIIGEGAFHYNFGALNHHSNELTDILENLFMDSSKPSESTVLYRAFRRSLPQSVSEISDYYSKCFPTKEEKRFAHFQLTSKKIARDLLSRHSAMGFSDDETNKDVLSVLARSKDEKDPKKSLDEDEILSQMATIILAGHDTTAVSMAWILYEICKHPEDQVKIHEEIHRIRSKKSGELSHTDYDSLPYFNAVIKEGLRFHSITTFLYRSSDFDDSIPLSQPLTTISGEQITQIPIHHGQRIILCLGAYNRLSSVWGIDANEWNPSRFLVDNMKQQIPVGLYANTLSFSAGARGCIGWNFAVLEMQAILFRLLESFEFSIPPGVEIQKVLATIAVPMVRGRLDEGIQMPITVKIRG